MERELIGWTWEAMRVHLEDEMQYVLNIGDTVKIISDAYTNQQGELQVIDEDADEGDFYGVYLDSTESTVFFRLDELEKVSQ